MNLDILQQLSFSEDKQEKASFIDFLIDCAKNAKTDSNLFYDGNCFQDFESVIDGNKILIHINFLENFKLQFIVYRQELNGSTPIPWEIHHKNILQKIPYLNKFLYYKDNKIELVVSKEEQTDFILNLGIKEMLFCDPIQFTPLKIDNHQNWNFQLTLNSLGKIWGEFFNDKQKVNLWDIPFINDQGLFFYNNTLSLIINETTYKIVQYLIQTGPARISISHEIGKLCYYYAKISFGTLIQLPNDYRIITQLNNCIPTLYLKTPLEKKIRFMQASVWFFYASKEFISTNIEKFHTQIPIEYKQQEKTIILHLRNIPQEREHENFLQENPNFIFSEKTQFYKFDLKNILESIHLFLDKNWIVWAQEKKLKKITDFSFNITPTHSNFFDMVFEFSGLKFGPSEIIKMLKAKNIFIPLDDGHLGVLPAQWYSKFQLIFDVCSDSMNANQAKSVEKILESMGNKTSSSFDFSQLDLTNLTNIAIVPPGEKFKATLREYQLFGFSWLWHLYQEQLGGILADDMGLGKTIQIIAFIEKIISSNTKPKSLFLIIAPKSLLGQWQLEFARFAPHLSTLILKKFHINKLKSLAHMHRIFITNYHTARIHMDSFSSIFFECIIFDEAQFIKNENSQIYQSMEKLQSQCRFCLTGTPIENKIEDLINLFHIIHPGLFPLNFKANSYQENPDYYQLLFSNIQPFILRRMKDEVLSELPPKTEQIITLQMHGSQKDEYEKLLKIYHQKFNQVMEEGTFEENKLYFLEGLLRLRQICDHPYIMNHNLYDEEDSCKIKHLMQKTQELVETDHKIVIFSQFIDFLDYIKKCLERRSISFCYLDGKSENREEIVQQFQTNTQIKAFLISLKAGGFGLNLTSADYCFLMDPWWNRAIENQAIDRIYRIGQYRSVFIYKYIIKGTIEEKMHTLSTSKQGLLDRINTTQDHNDFLQHFKADDFRDFFSF